MVRYDDDDDDDELNLFSSNMTHSPIFCVLSRMWWPLFVDHTALGTHLEPALKPPCVGGGKHNSRVAANQ